MSAQFGSHSPRTYLLLEWLLFRRGSLRGPEGAITTISLPILFPNPTSQWSNPIPTNRIQKTFPCVAGVSKNLREGNDTPISIFDISLPFSVIKPLSQWPESHIPQDKNRPIPVPSLSGFGTLLELHGAVLCISPQFCLHLAMANRWPSSNNEQN